MKTDQLIAELAATAEPVQSLRPPWARMALWLILALPTIILAIAIHGLDVDLAAALRNWRFVVEQVATLATALTAAIAALTSTVPGSSRKLYWLPLFPLVVWLATVGAGCVQDYQVLGPAAFSLRIDTGCFIPMVLVGIVPAFTMVTMLQRGAPLSPRLSMVLAALATAALVNFALRFFHFGDVSIMVLVWHFGLIALLSTIAGYIAPRVFGWGRLFANVPIARRFA